MKIKKVAILILCVGGLSVSGFTQETEKENQPERIKLYPSNHETSKQDPAKEIAALESQLDALEVKEEKIRQNPEELKIATENGWFEQTEATRKKINARINELKKK